MRHPADIKIDKQSDAQILQIYKVKIVFIHLGNVPKLSVPLVGALNHSVHYAAPNARFLSNTPATGQRHHSV
jgi:hypothetical protein